MVSTLSKGGNFAIESFDIVAVCGNKVERCFDIVAGVDRALQPAYVCVYCSHTTTTNSVRLIND